MTGFWFLTWRQEKAEQQQSNRCDVHFAAAAAGVAVVFVVTAKGFTLFTT